MSLFLRGTADVFRGMSHKLLSKSSAKIKKQVMITMWTEREEAKEQTWLNDDNR